MLNMTMKESQCQQTEIGSRSTKVLDYTHKREKMMQEKISFKLTSEICLLVQKLE